MGGHTGYARSHDRHEHRYARFSTDQQDLTAQCDGLQALGVPAERIYVDHGLTGTNRERPGLHQALAACRAGDTLRTRGLIHPGWYERTRTVECAPATLYA
jgi:hypothetical protein